MKTQNSIINTFATAHDCAVITDSDGFVALQERAYNEGVLQVRHAPDGCDFYKVSAWETAITESPGMAMRWIC